MIVYQVRDEEEMQDNSPADSQPQNNPEMFGQVITYIFVFTVLLLLGCFVITVTQPTPPAL